MTDYIDFIIALRSLDLNEVTFEFYKDITPNLKECVDGLSKVEYKDGFIHCFYEELKKSVAFFINFWIDTIEEVTKLEDKHNNVTSKTILLELLDNTIIQTKDKYENFEKDFIIYGKTSHNEIHMTLNNKYQDYMETILKLKDKVERFDKAEYALPFAQEHIYKTLRKIHAFLDFTHTTIGLKLASLRYEIRMSLEDIFNRVRNNNRDFQASAETDTNKLLYELYEKNKDHIILLRKFPRSSIKIIETERTIQKLQSQIECRPNECCYKDVEEELTYWTKRVNEFHKINDNLDKLKTKQDEIERQISIYNKYRCTEYPGSKACCWENIGLSYSKHQTYLKEKYCEISKSLLTFFYIRGPAKSSPIGISGRYVRDDFNHLAYHAQFGTKVFHSTCDGKLIRCNDKDIFYYDANGKYILDKSGEKIYKAMDCRSEYKLNDDNTMLKISKDCGHSEEFKKECKVEYPRYGVAPLLLPETKEAIDINESLDTEVVNYLWNNLAGILTMSLCEVGKAQPSNPIHFLAHRLLANKYGKTLKQLKQEQKDADNYRDGLYKQRKEKAIKESKLWKSKQVKKRLPEESDDSQDLTEAYYHATMQMVEGIHEE